MMCRFNFQDQGRLITLTYIWMEGGSPGQHVISRRPEWPITTPERKSTEDAITEL